jgi:hypothetical protein
MALGGPDQIGGTSPRTAKEGPASFGERKGPKSFISCVRPEGFWVTASLAVRGIPTAPLGSSLLLMICNTERPPWRCPRKPPNLSHCPREIVSGESRGGRYEYTRGNFGQVLRSRYRRL